jgi:tRNA(fMet)-specific endonuclease VapC
VSAYCFDTDVLSVLMRPHPPPHLIRRMATVPGSEQVTTAVSLAELLYGAARRGGQELAERAHALVDYAVNAVLPFDEAAAEVYGPLRALLERAGRRLDEPDLRIASIAVARDLTLVTGNVKHFARVPDLRVENWLAG